ncbi:Uncharacterised protein [Acinetobacter baumannii]|nr:Uncharacterised protein [Acinetobacter baumannii]SSQ43313.1 Uncharacterised protein [Acinetobacter baumannii]SVK02368.1 Uncharacterised protein [Acinetobacter baumannii]
MPIATPFTLAIIGFGKVAKLFKKTIEAGGSEVVVSRFSNAFTSLPLVNAESSPVSTTT